MAGRCCLCAEVVVVQVFQNMLPAGGQTASTQHCVYARVQSPATMHSSAMHITLQGSAQPHATLHLPPSLPPSHSPTSHSLLRPGAQLLPEGSAPHGLRPTRDVVLSTAKERLDQGLSFLQLPQHIATSARQLLPQVVEAYGSAEPRMIMSLAAVAAVIYVAARQEHYALSFGAAAAALNAEGSHVYHECQ